MPTDHTIVVEIPVILLGAAVAPSLAMLINDARLNDVTGTILAAAIEVHRILGPGLFEAVYQPCLRYELNARGLRVIGEQCCPVVYKDLRIESAYKLDLLVEDLVIVEIKSVETLLPVHRAQVVTYLRLTQKPAGLLINFNVPRLMDGVKRVLNTR